MRVLFLLFVLNMMALRLQSQNMTVNVNPQVSAFMDSVFVIPAGTTDSFHSGNHPGAGGYMNGRIIICSGATLKYNFMMSTSSQPTFYLEVGATLRAEQTFFAPVYLKSNAIFNANGHMVYQYFYRHTNALIQNMGAGSSLFMDSVYNTVNYTFNGWPGNVSPCSSPNLIDEMYFEESELRYNGQQIVFNGPAGNWAIYDLSGAILRTSDLGIINTQGLVPGLYFLKGENQGKIKVFKFIKTN